MQDSNIVGTVSEESTQFGEPSDTMWCENRNADGRAGGVRDRRDPPPLPNTTTELRNQASEDVNGDDVHEG